MANEGMKVTTTQTAAQAVRAIIKKFGTISDSKHYYHRGNGVWSVYAISEDRKKTGKITSNKKKWKAEPWRYDLRKVDTKEGLVKRKVKAKKDKNSKYKQTGLFRRF